MKKLLALLLCALMLAPTFVSCADNADSTDPNGGTASAPAVDSGDTSEETEITRATTPDNLPDDLNFNGMSLNVYHFGNENTIKYDCAGELSGDIVMDAVYNRNLSVEERLNVKFNWIAGDATWDGFPNEVSLALQAGTGD